MQSKQRIVSSLWDRHSWVKHAVCVFKILPMLAVNIPVLDLEIIIFQNLHTLLNSRGCCHRASCIAYGQTAAMAGRNEHLETGTKSTEILNIMLLKIKI